MSLQTKCGTVSILGRPNVGKSSLLNAILRKKISAVSHRASTTIKPIRGILTRGLSQFVFIDTPGQEKGNNLRIASDVAVLLVDALRFKQFDAPIFHPLLIIAINKTDKIKDKEKILPLICKINKSHGFKALVPISVKTRYNLDVLLVEIDKLLPYSSFIFSKESLTDASDAEIVNGLIRERLFFNLKQEIPHTVLVKTEKILFKEKKIVIFSNIITKNIKHKQIIIGKNGNLIKKISTESRVEIEKYLNCQVFLYLFLISGEN